MNKWDDWHILTGKPIAAGDGPHLDHNPDLWESLWRKHGHRLLAAWIMDHPGERPAAWWAFDAPGELAEGESQLDYLDRHRLIGSKERRAMLRQTMAIVYYNHGRNPGRPSDNFIPYDPIHRYTLAHPIAGLTPQERRLIAELDPAMLEIGAEPSPELESEVFCHAERSLR
jgi:hypothetical protein